MSITFGAGIRLGAGMSVTPTPIDLRWDTNYISTNLGTTNNDTALYLDAPGQYTCLTTQQMTSTGKYMISFTMIYDSDITSGIGIGSRSVNLNNYLGSDTNGFGFYQNGELYYDGAAVVTGLPTWTEGDVIDVAVNNQGNNAWIRVNGGYWNNDPGSNPATNTNGVEINAGLFFAATMGGYSGPSEIALCLESLYTVPAGYTFWGPGLGLDTTFTINVGDFANGTPIYQNTNPLGTNGTEGFENTSQETWLGEGYFMSQLTHDTIVRMSAALTAAGINSSNTTGHVFLASFGAGSSIAYGLVKLGFTDGGGVEANAYIDIQVIDWLTNTDWETPDSNNGYSLVGTFKFPATFAVYTPLIAKGGWC